MKKMWNEPVIMVEKFMPNEYAAACEGGKYYIFQCNAPAGTLYYYPQGDGSIDGTYTGSGRAKGLGGFVPNTSVRHLASTTDEFFDGFIDRDRDGRQDPGEGVIVWLEYGHRWGHTYLKDYHATKELDMRTWDTNKS